jgi:hypothetical protein
MLDDAALALEGARGQDPHPGSRSACCPLYHGEEMGMAAALAGLLVKVEPENEAWWISLAFRQAERER